SAEFDSIGKLGWVKKYSFYVILLLSVVTSTYFATYITIPPEILDILKMIYVFIIILYFVISTIIDNILVPNAYKTTRYDFYDNSFGTKFIYDKNSIDYYTNDEIPQGFYRMAVN